MCRTVFIVIIPMRKSKPLKSAIGSNLGGNCVRSEVFTALTMKNAVFWDVTPCGCCKYRSFGGVIFLRNVDSYKSRTASRPRRRHCDGHSLWLPETLAPPGLELGLRVIVSVL
jgi:hypothetical protein